MFKAKAGSLLIAEPFLKDPNFTRTVILLCEHQFEGSFGLVLNKLLNLKLSDVFEDVLDSNIEIHFGGPVNMDTIHILHQLPDVIPNSVIVAPNVYWGGDFDVVMQLIKTKSIDLSKIKFYLGYSGWSEGQLQDEIIKTSTWLTTDSNAEIIFNTSNHNIWQASIFAMGKEYAPLVNYPIDPQLN